MGLQRIRVGLFLFGLLLSLPAWSNPETAAPASAVPDPFPVPAVLKPNVAFWCKVFAVWRRDQVVLHDSDHLGLIYETLELPGPVGERQSRAQRDYVRRARAALEDRLARLERRVRGGRVLDARQRALLARIIAFAGPHALAGAADRVRAQRGMRGRFLRGLERSGRYEARFRAIFRAAGLPPDLAYLPHVESSFRSAARSSAGAVGMWQFTRSAGRVFLQIDRAVDERRDPFAAARAAAGYLKTAYAALESWPLAVTSYNYGILGMMQARERYGTDFTRILQDYRSRTFGFASRNFYAEFLAARAIARDPRRWFGHAIRYDRPIAQDRVVLKRPVRVRVLAAHYRVAPVTLAALNPAWNRIVVRGRIPLPAGSTVRLPAGRVAEFGIAHRWARLHRAPHPVPVVLRLIRAAEAQVRGAGSRALYHIVRRDETLTGIARRYRIPLPRLRALNGIPRGDDLIRIGERLLVRAPRY